MKPALLVLSLLFVPWLASAQLSGLGVHGGVGTDITLGLAVGGGVSFVLPGTKTPAVEVGADFFYHHSTETTSEQVGPALNEYTDTTTLYVFAVTANMLFRYTPKELGLYYLAGGGIGAMNASWVGQSEDDPTYNDTSEGTTAGLILNLGIGLTLPLGFDLRLQLPTFIVFGIVRNVFVPTATAAVGFRL
jgi:hypothetical protein